MDKDSADRLVQRMNSITEAFKDKVDDADALLVQSEDIIDESSALVTAEIKKPSPNVNLAEVLNLQNMIDDVKYIRETLTECSSTGKKLLKSMAQEIEIEPDARLLEGYSSLCNVINENMKLYLQCSRHKSCRAWRSRESYFNNFHIGRVWAQKNGVAINATPLSSFSV